jgi:glycosyltransferase involved in cell wall biosynthesis
VDNSLSVVIPVRNGARTIVEQLDAIAAQDRLPDEIVVADNGSSDDTVAVVTGWAATSSIPTTVIDASDRASANHARNRGRTVATGEWLLFLDADDEAQPGLVAALHDARARRSLVSAMLLRTDHDGAPTSRSRPFAGRFYGVAHGHAGAMLVHAADLDDLGGFSEVHQRNQDVEISLRALVRGWEIVHVPSALLHYRHRASTRARVKQTFLWAYDDARLVAEFRSSVALDSPSWPRALRGFAAVSAKSIRRLRRRDDRLRAVLALAQASGHLVGAIRWRTPA